MESYIERGILASRRHIQDTYMFRKFDSRTLNRGPWYDDTFFPGNAYGLCIDGFKMEYYY